MNNLHYLCSPQCTLSQGPSVSNSFWSWSLNTLMWFLTPPKTHPPTAPYCGELRTYLLGWHRWRADCWTSLDGRTSLHPGSCTQTDKHTCTHASHYINHWLGKSDKFQSFITTLWVLFRNRNNLGGGGSTSGVENICTSYPLNISHTHALYRYRYQCNILINTCIHRMSCITVCIGTWAMPAQSLVNNLQSHRTTRFRKQICYKLFSTV